MALALACGLPLGVLCYVLRRLGLVLLGLVNVIYTIPALALFGLMIPLLGIGLVPAVVAVFLYSLLPVVQTTVTGLENVDAPVREAAIAIGMGRATRFWRIEFPLALPVIFGGVRLAVVNGIGMVTLASLIGAGGLGDLIFRGISTVSWPMVVAGSLPVLILAVLADLVFREIERLLTRRLGVARP